MLQEHVLPHLTEEVLTTMSTALTPEVLKAPKANKPKARLQMLQELRSLIFTLQALNKAEVLPWLAYHLSCQARCVGD